MDPSGALDERDGDAEADGFDDFYRLSEAARIRAHRLARATRLGFEPDAAEELADLKGGDGWPVDLHRLAWMLERGCTHEVALAVVL